MRSPSMSTRERAASTSWRGAPASPATNVRDRLAGNHGHVLLQISDGQAGLDVKLTLVGLDDPGEHFEDGGFPRSVPAHKAGPHAGRDGRARPRDEQRLAAEADGSVLQRQNGRVGGHLQGSYLIPRWAQILS